MVGTILGLATFVEITMESQGMGMTRCVPERLVANKIMLNVRCVFMTETGRDIREYEYNDILMASGCSAIIKE
jgi:hypothetical protein